MGKERSRVTPSGSLLTRCHPERSVYSRGVKDLESQSPPDSRIGRQPHSEILRCAEYGCAQDDNFGGGNPLLRSRQLPDFHARTRDSVEALRRETLVPLEEAVHRIVLFDVVTFELEEDDASVEVEVLLEGGVDQVVVVGHDVPLPLL